MFKYLNTSKMIQTLNGYFLSARIWLQTQTLRKDSQITGIWY